MNDGRRNQVFLRTSSLLSTFVPK